MMPIPSACVIPLITRTLLSQKPAPQIAVRGLLTIDLNIELAFFQALDLLRRQIERGLHLAAGCMGDCYIQNRETTHAGDWSLVHFASDGSRSQPFKRSRNRKLRARQSGRRRADARDIFPRLCLYRHGE